MSHSHEELGSLLGNSDTWGEAENEQRLALAIRAQLASEFPAVPGYRRYLARSHYQLGVCLGEGKQYSEALSEFVLSIELRKKLQAEFPQDEELLHAIAGAQNDWGLALYRMKRRTEAIAAYREALESWSRLVERFPDDAPYLNGTAKTLRMLGGFMRTDGKIDEAGELYAQAALHQHTAHQAVPANSSYLDELRNDYHSLGDVALLRKDHKVAADAAGKLGLVRPHVADDALLAARILGRCDQLVANDLKLSEPERLTLRQSYAEQAMQHLHEAVRRGYANAAALKTFTALAPLRERADFQLLVSSLESR